MGDSFGFAATKWSWSSTRTREVRTIATWFELIALLANSHSKMAQYDYDLNCWMIDGRHAFNRADRSELRHLNDVPECIQLKGKDVEGVALIRYAPRLA
jgi:hypothetical protein